MWNRKQGDERLALLWGARWPFPAADCWEDLEQQGWTAFAGAPPFALVHPDLKILDAAGIPSVPRTGYIWTVRRAAWLVSDLQVLDVPVPEICRLLGLGPAHPHVERYLALLALRS